MEACLAEGVPALVHREACSKPSCSPKFQVLVRPEEAPLTVSAEELPPLLSVRDYLTRHHPTESP